jgi:hypothetical protein
VQALGIAVLVAFAVAVGVEVTVWVDVGVDVRVGVAVCVFVQVTVGEAVPVQVTVGVAVGAAGWGAAGAGLESFLQETNPHVTTKQTTIRAANFLTGLS